MICIPRSTTHSRFINLLLCLAISLSFTPAGLAGEPEAEDTEVYLPLVMKPVLFQESTGILDASFDGDGSQLTDFFGDDDTAKAIALQTDGKILAAGYAQNASVDIALARFNPDGSLDTTFDGDGKVTTDFDGNSDFGLAIALQPDGKIIVAGVTWSLWENMDFALVRYNADGSLDSTFDTDGKVVTDIGEQSQNGQAVVVQPDGKIIISGTTTNDLTGRDFALVRYNPDGSLDSTFDGDGMVVTDFAGSNDDNNAMFLQADGKIIAAGYSTYPPDDSDFALVRYNPDGSLDSTFDGDGRLVTDFYADNDFATGLALQPDGKIIVSGYTQTTSYDFAVARYNSDGSLDTSFSGDGKLATDFAGGFDHGYGVVLQPNGKIIVVGETYADTSDIALVRYNPDGSLDPTFGTGGILTTDIMNSFDHAYAVVLQPDGKIIVTGYIYKEIDEDFVLVRYQ